MGLHTNIKTFWNEFILNLNIKALSEVQRSSYIYYYHPVNMDQIYQAGNTNVWLLLPFLHQNCYITFLGGLWLNVYLYYGIASLEASIQLGEGEGFWMHWYHIPMLPQSWIISSHSCKVKHTSSSSYLRTVFATIWKVDSFILSNTLHHSVLEEIYSSCLK